MLMEDIAQTWFVAMTATALLDSEEQTVEVSHDSMIAEAASLQIL